MGTKNEYTLLLTNGNVFTEWRAYADFYEADDTVRFYENRPASDPRIVATFPKSAVTGIMVAYAS